MNRFYIIWVFTVFLSVCAYGRECKPSRDIDIRFRFDRSDLDTAYMDNARALKCIDAVLAECPFDEIDSIVVESTSSPEGDYAYNRKLSARRAASMLGYLTRRYPSLTLKIYSSQKAESWEMLQECIAEDPRISAADKESLLSLLRSKEGVQLKKTRLSAHRLYSYIYKNHYRRLRRSSVKIYCAEFPAKDSVKVTQIPPPSANYTNIA